MMNKVLKELGAMFLAIIVNAIPILTACSFIYDSTVKAILIVVNIGEIILVGLAFSRMSEESE